MQTDEIISLTKANSAAHRECTGFLKAVESVENEIAAIAGAALDTGKLRNFAYRFADTACAAASSGKGRVKKRFLSALTPQGITVFYETVPAFAERVIVLRDAYGLASSEILSAVSGAAVRAGFDAVQCMCPLRPETKIEHVLIPALSLAVCTSNAAHPFDEGGRKTVNCAKFFRAEALSRHKNRLAFNRKAERELLDAALQKLREAKRLHDELERRYIRAMDFAGLNAFADAWIPSLLEEA